MNRFGYVLDDIDNINYCLLQLKAFYVDLLVPLETNLEKDTKVVQVCTLLIQVILFNKYFFYYSTSYAIN